MRYKQTSQLLIFSVVMMFANYTNASYLLFDEATDTINISGDTILDSTVTIEAQIVFTPEYNGSGVVFNEWKHAYEDKRFSIGPQVISGYLFQYSSTVRTAIIADTSVTIGCSHHIAYVYDGSEERLYLDGNLKESRNYTGNISDNTTSISHIGAIYRDSKTNNSFVGYLNSFRISDEARYTSNFVPPSGDFASDGNTLLLYNFNEPPGSSIVNDLSGNGHHGTLGVGFTGATSPIYSDLNIEDCEDPALNTIVFGSKPSGNEEICSMDLNGKNIAILTNSISSDGTPSFSPDQKYIVFGSDREQPEGPWEIFTMPSSGSGFTSPVNITNNPADDGWPVWSPRGDRILFLSNRDENNPDPEHYDIYTVDPDGQNEAQISFGYDVGHAAWSPNASQIVFASTGELHIVNLSTGLINTLTENDHYDDYPSWSPDNKYIIYSSAQISNNDDRLDLFMIDIDSKSINTIMEDDELDIRYPVWLPNGRVVFVMATENQKSTREIFITKGKVNFDSTLTLSDVTPLTENDFEDNHPMVAMPLMRLAVITLDALSGGATGVSPTSDIDGNGKIGLEDTIGFLQNLAE